jgi:hypothetical protein
MKKKLLLFSIVNCFIVSITLGQSITNLNTDSPPSQTSLSIGEAANIANNVDLYTGRLNYNVPLKNIKIAGIPIPIGLHYSTAGFKVQEIAGAEGLGWNTNFGGIITRSIRGLPDDDPNGYCGANRIGGKNYITLDKTFFQNTTSNTWDSEPDVFYFSVMGLTGTFVLDPDGNPVLQSHSSGLRIDACPFKRGSTAGSVKWILQDQSGNQYIFEDSAIESTYNYYHGEKTNTYKNFASSWYITKIITAANEVINFSYISGTIAYTDYINQKRTSGDPQYCTGNTPNATWNENIDASVTTPYLSQISGDNIQVQLSYNSYRADITNGKSLSSISILYKGATTNTYSFGYDYFYSADGTGTSRLKLQNISENYVGNSSKSLYSFYYNEAVNLPARNSIKTDYWGYYNNNASDNNIIGFSDKTPYVTNTAANVLTRVQTIFGGSIYFDYELNNYYENNQNNPIGGLRLRDIYQKNTDSDPTILNQINYSYNTTSSANSSGQKFIDFLNSRIYQVHVFCDPGNATQMYYSSEPTNSLFDYNGSSVGYSNVTVTNINGSASRYTFTNYTDYPDTFQQALYSSYDNTTNYYAVLKPNFPVTSYSFARGKILKQEDMNNNDVVKSVQYTYALSAPVGSVIGIKAVLSDLSIPAGTPYYQYILGKYSFFTQDLLLNSKSESYIQAGTVKQNTVQNYTYTTYASNLLRSVTNIVSGGKTDKYTFRYPFDVVPSIPTTAPASSLVLTAMTYNNNIALPVEVVHSVIHNSLESVVAVNTTQYSLFANGLYLPQQEYRFESSIPLPISQFTNYTVSIANGITENGNFDARMKPFLAYDSFDSHNNLLQSESITNQPVYSASLFGYDGMYKIAQVANASQIDIAYTSFESADLGNWQYSGTPLFDVTTITGKKYYNLANGSLVKTGLTTTKTYFLTYWTKNASSLTITGTQGAAILLSNRNGWYNYKHIITGVSSVSVGGTGAIDEVRLCPSNAQMNTFTYDPFVGMRSKTDFNNQSTYYDYDEFNRLAFVKDNNKNIIQGYCYNFKGEQTNCFTYFSNNTLPGPFTKNDCAPFYSGSQVPYSVQAGLYNATSQAAADGLAFKEGQAYANTNGSCIPYITVSLRNSTGTAYQANFISGTTNITCDFSNVSVQLPVGTYSINIYPSGSSYVVHTITVGSQTANAPRTTFYGVDISVAANQTITIY